MARIYLLLAVLLVIEVLCVYQVIKLKKWIAWIYIIIFIPVAGIIAYFIIEIIPDFITNLTGHNYPVKPDEVRVQGNKISEYESLLERNDTVENRLNLADEYMNGAMWEKAINLYKRSIEGKYKDDSGIKYKIANAYYGLGQYDNAYDYIMKLAGEDGMFKKFNEWKLYVLVIESLGDDEKAEKEYETFVNTNRNFEALYLYGIFLKKIGKTEKSIEQFEKIITQGESLKEFTFHNNKEWIRKANMEIKISQMLK